MFPQQSQLGSTTNCLPWQDAAQYKTWRQLPANHLFFCVEIECIKPVFSERLINVLLQRSQCEIFTVIKFSVIGIKRSRPTMNNKSQQTVVFFRGLGPFVSRRPPHESTRENLWLSGYNYLHTFNQLHIFNVKLTCYLSLDSVMKTMCMQSSTLSISFFLLVGNSQELSISAKDCVHVCGQRGCQRVGSSIKPFRHVVLCFSLGNTVSPQVHELTAYRRTVRKP